MLNRKYDPSLPYRYVRYGRMSDPRQNPRSPDQQFDTIEDRRARLGHPWVLVGTYRDDGISGRYLKKRPGFQAMLRDIEVGLIAVDAIAVDTLERFGRADEIAEVRRKLLATHGVVVVTADSGFADPTGATGKALGFVENLRSTEAGRVKAHDVVRGKKDAALLGHWPGGPPPLGFRLKTVVDESAAKPRVYSVIEPVPAHADAVRLAFARADDTGHGGLRLAKWWNACPDIPAELKPTSQYSMGYLLSNPIYAGTLVWGANCTGVVNDTRVVEPNPDGPVAVVPDFCPPLVDRDVFDRVQHLRAVRSESVRARRAGAKSDAPAKLIAPQARGLAIKHLLTGLVRCGLCRSSMRPTSSRRKTESGKEYAYTHYACPRADAGACGNTRYVREDHLREAAIARLRSRLFPPACDSGQLPDWLPGLVALVEQDLGRRAAGPDRGAARDAELRDLGARLDGWAMTLGDPQLPAAVRTDIAERYGRAKARRAELEAQAGGDRALGDRLGRVLDPRAVADHLRRLGDILAGHNPTLGNLELGRHVEHVLCFPDGRVEMRGTWLGVLGGAAHLLSREPGGAAGDAPPPAGAVAPRKRGRLRLPDLSADSGADAADADTCLDPDRFAGLADAFFWSEDVAVERAPSWSEANAAAVAAARAEGLTQEQLAARFGVSVPTARKALRLAAGAGLGDAGLPRKMPRARWQDSHAGEVRALRLGGQTLKQLAAHFGVSEPLIRAALAIAASGADPAAPPAEPPPCPAGPDGG